MFIPKTSKGMKTCCYKWQQSKDHIVKVNGQEVGMCNDYCHKTEKEALNENIILKKDGISNFLFLKEKSCADVRVTYVFTGGVDEYPVPQSGDSCQDEHQNA